MFDLVNALPSIDYSAMTDVEPHPSLFAYLDTIFEIIKKQIQEYEQSLDADHEVAIWLTNFGHSVIMHVAEVGYKKSAVLVFKGFVDGRYSTLVQHVSQLNLLLTSVEKDPNRPKRQIGFVCPSEQ